LTSDETKKGSPQWAALSFLCVLLGDRADFKCKKARNLAPGLLLIREEFLLCCFRCFGLRDGPVGCANLEAREAANGDVLPELGYFLRDQFLDGD
jgi:hypothetical protein